MAGPVYAATGSKRTAILWAGISGLAEILGGVLAWLILGSMISPGGHGGNHGGGCRNYGGALG